VLAAAQRRRWVCRGSSELSWSCAHDGGSDHSDYLLNLRPETPDILKRGMPPGRRPRHPYPALIANKKPYLTFRVNSDWRRRRGVINRRSSCARPMSLLIPCEGTHVRACVIERCQKKKKIINHSFGVSFVLLIEHIT
jgi:hypothetical protein